MKKTKLLILMGACLLPIAGMTSCSNVSFNTKEVNLYVVSSQNVQKMNLHFSSQYEGIPYVELKEAGNLLQTLYSSDEASNTPYHTQYSITTEGNLFTLARENGSYITFDTSANTIYSNNIKAITSMPYNNHPLNAASLDGNFYDEDGKVIEGQVRLLQVDETRSYEVASNSTLINLNSYNIDLVNYNSNCYIPFTTFVNLAFPTTAGMIYNGENIFLIGNGALNSTIKDDAGKTQFDYFYEGAANRTRSQKLINYNYNELCRNLDYTYGLKEQHGITSFYNYFERTGVKEKLMSSKKLDLDFGYYELEYTYFSDLHSRYDFQGAYGEYDASEGQKIIEAGLKINPYYSRFWTNRGYVNEGRLNNGVITEAGAVKNPITINGDTMIITFDSFAQAITKLDDYYSDEFKQNKETIAKSGADTYALISYANDLINANSNISRVVLDLSANTGGAVSAGAYVLSWLGSGVIHIQDAINEGLGTYSYKADINLDKVSDSKDDLTKNSQIKEIYCLESGVSFSCGNLVPCMLKEVGKVKLVGTTSGGGACAVGFSGSADGTMMQYSSSLKLSTEKNGSYYDIDQGAAPDYYLSDLKTLYGGTNGDRANLVTYLETLESLN